VNQLFRVASKEFATFFSTPIAFIFFGVFLAVTLFVFFWLEAFFARNIADVRPLFEWMPVLLIFLVAAITMRMWSEESRTGTLEFLLTSPVRPVHLVIGKLLACLGLVAVALLMTLPIPMTVAWLGNLDWGPVWGGYLASLFLAAAYIAIGLFVSARSDNQIVSLIVTTVICGALYLLGSDLLTGFFGHRIAEFLGLLGSGSRFESITRGVLDLRDLYYYLSLVGMFVALNVLALEWLRWSGNATNPQHTRWTWLTALVVGNFLVANFWIAPIGWARADITSGHVYSISPATRGYLARLQEPMLIRGYFSAQTHPLLAPLVPRLRDLLTEYAVAGQGRVRVEFIDPLDRPELEQEAGERFGIKPVAFQMADKYQAALVNSYFDIVVQYGDQFEVLGFRDLIDVKVRNATADLEVELRNPEYDLTRAIKKVLYSYQGGGDLFASISRPLKFTGYFSPAANLPEPLQALRTDIEQALSDWQAQSADKLQAVYLDPQADGGALAEQLRTEYGFRPMTTGLLDPNSFWFYMTLEGDGRIVQVPLPEGLDKVGFERSFKAALKRFSKGFLKTIAMHAPKYQAELPQFGIPGAGNSFTLLIDTLREEHNVAATDLADGRVPDEADLLLVTAPQSLDDKQLFAIDQYLMRGGTLVLASSPFDIETDKALAARPHQSGLGEWLVHHGITIEKSMVLDPQNAAFPIPVQRNVGGFIVQETRQLDYPYFIDIRQDGMDDSSGITAGLGQVTLNWASPILIDSVKNQQRQVLRLLESTVQSWTSDSLQMQPDLVAYPLGFPEGETRGRQLLGVVIEGRFESYFKDKPSPLVAADGQAKDEQPQTEEGAEGTQAKTDKADTPTYSRVIDSSPEAARIILFASNSFLTDDLLDLASGGMGTRYLNPVRLVENAIDWSLEERDLLVMRGRSQYSRTLVPLERSAQIIWEVLNYALALLGLAAVWLIRRQRQSRAQAHYRAMLQAEG
jgi:ABC-2 type transport system permease protein